ncbi:MAG: antitoxin [Bacteroidota bacterium]
MSRLSIEVSPEQHQQIKALAALQGKSIKDYILDKLFPTEKEEEQAAMKELQALLKKRIAEAENSEPVNISLTQIAEDILRRNNEL